MMIGWWVVVVITYVRKVNYRMNVVNSVPPNLKITSGMSVVLFVVNPLLLGLWIFK